MVEQKIAGGRQISYELVVVAAEQVAGQQVLYGLAVVAVEPTAAGRQAA